MTISEITVRVTAGLYKVETRAADGASETVMCAEPDGALRAVARALGGDAGAARAADADGRGPFLLCGCRRDGARLCEAHARKAFD